MTRHDVILLRPDEVDFVLDPHARETFGPFGRPYLALELAAIDSSANDVDALAAALQRMPCPILAIGSPTHALARAADVLVDTPGALSSVVANIARAPIASATLVQTLRATSMLEPLVALTVESLAYATLQGGAEFSHWLASRKAEPPRPPETGSAVIIEREGNLLRLTLNRPRNRNAISVDMRDTLIEAFDLVLADSAIEHVVLSGAGACFSVGGDVSEFGTASDPATAHAVRSARLPGERLQRFATRAESIVHGAVIGAGVEIAAFAGTVRAKPNAFFQLPEIRFGLIPGAGGCVSVPARIGRQKTAYLALSARRISARTALQWGLVDEIVS